MAAPHRRLSSTPQSRCYRDVSKTAPPLLVVFCTTRVGGLFPNITLCEGRAHHSHRRCQYRTRLLITVRVPQRRHVLCASTAHRTAARYDSTAHPTDVRYASTAHRTAVPDLRDDGKSFLVVRALAVVERPRLVQNSDLFSTAHRTPGTKPRAVCQYKPGTKHIAIQYCTSHAWYKTTLFLVSVLQICEGIVSTIRHVSTGLRVGGCTWIAVFARPPYMSIATIIRPVVAPYPSTIPEVSTEILQKDTRSQYRDPVAPYPMSVPIPRNNNTYDGTAHCVSKSFYISVPYDSTGDGVGGA
eukprot:3447858-Rhodomonas_salina.2